MSKSATGRTARRSRRPGRRVVSRPVRCTLREHARSPQHDRDRAASVPRRYRGCSRIEMLRFVPDSAAVAPRGLRECNLDQTRTVFDATKRLRPCGGGRRARGRCPNPRAALRHLAAWQLNLETSGRGEVPGTVATKGRKTPAGRGVRRAMPSRRDLGVNYWSKSAARGDRVTPPPQRFR